MATKNQPSTSSTKTSGTNSSKTTGNNSASTGTSGTSGIGTNSSTDSTDSNDSQYSTGSSYGLNETDEQNENTLSGLFTNLLKVAYNMEKQIAQALPEMAEAVTDEELKDAIEHHLEQTKKQAERIEKIFSRLRMDRGEKTCKITQALIQHGQETIQKYEEGPLLDAAIIIGAQKIEHHEIAVYGSLCELAEVLGYHKIADILDRTLEEEEDTDHLLSEIAKDINDEALEAEHENESYTSA